MRGVCNAGHQAQGRMQQAGNRHLPFDFIFLQKVYLLQCSI